MDYEKKYKEALANARQEYNTTENVERKQWLEELFPELKESKDERIRKMLIKAFGTIGKKDWGGLIVSDILTWLEKQDKVDTASYEVAENEKREFVGYGFLKCKGDFLSFKEGENYWLEYVGKDNYNVRSDNLLGQTFHITPQQLYTVFRPTTWLEKQNEQFEKNRLAACDNMTKEEAEREQKFTTDFIEKNHHVPTYSDAIEYGRKLMIDRADKLEELGQAMYDRMQNLTTDCTGIRAAMDKWWCYINRLNKED